MSPEEATTASVRVCDCFPALRDTTLAREARFREHPDEAAPLGPQSTVEVAVRSTGDLNEEAQSLKSGYTWTISEPAHVGGLANAPTPLEYLLSGAMGCFAAVFAFYAAKWGYDYSKFELDAKAHVDVRGHMIEDAPPSGFRDIEINVSVEAIGKTTEEDLQRVLSAALAGCPGIATLRDPVSMSPSLKVTLPT